MSGSVGKHVTVSPYLLWFVMHATQTGVGVLSFQSKLADGAGTDSWVSLLFTALAFHLVIAMLYPILRYAKEGDLVSIHSQLFGRYVGMALTLGFYLYCLLAVASQLRAYAEVITVWIFPEGRQWVTELIVLAVCAYIAVGGFRVVVGTALFAVVVPTLLLPSLRHPLHFAQWDNFLPMFNHSLPEYWASSGQAVFLFLGVEFLLVYYPFIKNNARTQKWAHIATAHTTVIYLIILLVTFAFLNLNQLANVVWPTLMLSKVIKLTIVERFDYVYIFTWFFVILPVCSVPLWSGARILKRSTGLPRRFGVSLSAILIFAITLAFQSPTGSQMLYRLVSSCGMSIVFGYIPLLFLIVLIRRLLERKALELRS
ncbi:GerAB/ArcD/ProY family transporter [Paenibacillus sp. PL2-23]|uniref:GerAB/ArcD/ProY family transporter n=1 Tax=Paenibacillus sp. PL2-23 TaxID=2100729 RepID=UPI0030F69A6A